jgi:hypothetical protein
MNTCIFNTEDAMRQDGRGGKPPLFLDSEETVSSFLFALIGGWAGLAA